MTLKTNVSDYLKRVKTRLPRADRLKSAPTQGKRVLIRPTRQEYHSSYKIQKTYNNINRTVYNSTKK